MERICELCGETFKGRSDKRFCSRVCKSLSYYYKNKAPEKIKGICEYCGKEFVGRLNKRFCSRVCKSIGYYHNNREERIEYSKNYKKINLETILAYELKNKEKRIKQHREAHLLRTYGISKETFDEIFIYIQKRRCMICGKSLEKYCVDHDHKTGEFRGLVCKKCNSTMGFVNDNIFILIKMIKYLKGERYGEITP